MSLSRGAMGRQSGGACLESPVLGAVLAIPPAGCETADGLAVPESPTGGLRPLAERVTTRHLLLFGLAWLVIGGVSAIDIYLTVRDQESLIYLELNPVARWILAWDDWNPATFVGLKFLGSMLVLGVLGIGLVRDPRRTSIVACALAVFQCGVLLFLAAA